MTIMDFDRMPSEEKRGRLLNCCGSKAWVEKMLAAPFSEDLIDLFQNAEEKWNECSEDDWKEAFNHQPEIGADTGEDALQKLAEASKQYREKFGYAFVSNPTGKSAEEIYTLLMVRLQNSPETEIEIAMDEQIGITRLCLEKLLQEE